MGIRIQLSWYIITIIVTDMSPSSQLTFLRRTASNMTRIPPSSDFPKICITHEQGPYVFIITPLASAHYYRYYAQQGVGQSAPCVT